MDDGIYTSGPEVYGTSSYRNFARVPRIVLAETDRGDQSV